MADKTRLPRWTPGSAISAADLNRLAEAIEAARVEVDSSGGLIPLQTPNGLKLLFRPPPMVAWATITTQVPAASGAVQGKGAGTLEYMVYSTSDVATATTTGVTAVPIYSGGKDVIAVGRRVMVVRDRNHWHCVVEYCV